MPCHRETPFSSGGAAASPSAIRNMLKFFLAAPFRGLTRLLSLDRLLDREEEPSHIISSFSIYNTEGGSNSPMTHMASPPPSTFRDCLGPWSFFASGYAISFFTMVRCVRRNIIFARLHWYPPAAVCYLTMDSMDQDHIMDSGIYPDSPPAPRSEPPIYPGGTFDHLQAGHKYAQRGRMDCG